MYVKKITLTEQKYIGSSSFPYEILFFQVHRMLVSNKKRNEQSTHLHSLGFKMKIENGIIGVYQNEDVCMK